MNGPEQTGLSCDTTCPYRALDPAALLLEAALQARREIRVCAEDGYFFHERPALIRQSTGRPDGRSLCISRYVNTDAVGTTGTHAGCKRDPIVYSDYAELRLDRSLYHTRTLVGKQGKGDQLSIHQQWLRRKIPRILN